MVHVHPFGMPCINHFVSQGFAKSGNKELGLEELTKLVLSSIPSEMSSSGLLSIKSWKVLTVDEVVKNFLARF